MSELKKKEFKPDWLHKVLLLLVVVSTSLLLIDLYTDFQRPSISDSIKDTYITTLFPNPNNLQKAIDNNLVDYEALTPTIKELLSVLTPKE